MINFISIIIPVFNPEFKLFARCYDSIKGITCPIEIIFVDDGSQIGIEECIEYTSLDERCHWIREKNGGVSSARNSGIVRANGKYILFIDVDDTITTEFRSYLNNFKLDRDSDWILFDIVDSNLSNNSIQHRKLFEETKECVLHIQDVIERRITTQTLSECWGKLISRKLLIENGIRFPLNIPTGEDAYFNTDIMKYAKTIRYIPIEAYIYYYDNSHLDRRLISNPGKRIVESFDRNKQLKELMKNKIDYPNVNQFTKKTNVSFVINLVQNCLILQNANMFNKAIKKDICEALKENETFLGLTLNDFLNLKGKIYYIILKYKLWPIIKIISIIKKNLK